MITTQALKNAARAIEHDLWTDTSGANYLVKDGAILRRWEPEHSSADSFELAVALSLNVEYDCYPPRSNQSRRIAFRVRVWAHGWHKEEFDSRELQLSATRLVILNAAASIGESLCQ